MNHVDLNYFELLRDILENGVDKDTRNGHVRSVFGRVIKHDMATGFPALTTKKLAWKQVVTELLWFLQGDTNIKFLLDHNCHIWDEDAYKGYEKQCVIHGVESMSKEQFISAIKLGNNKESHFIPDLSGYKLGDLGPIYGKQWRSWKRNASRDEKIVNPGVYHIYIDQIQNLINELKTNPDSRRLVVSAWNPTDLDASVLPPCHYGFQVYTRKLTALERENYYADINELSDEDRHTLNYGFDDSDVHTWADDLGLPGRAISLMWNQRSADVPLGLPFNIASYGLLLEILGRMANMIPEKLIGNVGDAHIYENQVDGVKEQLTRMMRVSPTLEISDSVKFDGGIDDFLNSCSVDDFKLKDYRHGGVIKFPLSN